MKQEPALSGHLRSRLAMEVKTIFNMELQANSQMTIYFVLSGHLELLHNGKAFSLKTGDVYLVNAYDLFGFVAEGVNHVLVTTLNSGDSYEMAKPLSPLYMKEAYDKISHTLAATFLEIETKQAGYEEIVEGYIYRLIGLFKRYLPTRFNEKEARHIATLSEKNKEIIDYINQHYQEELSLDRLAEHFFMSKYYLAHSFKEQVGLTVGNYLKEIRLIHSHLLVEQTDLSMIDIANQTGFSNVRSFSEGFKSKYGLSPMAYRQELADDKATSFISQKESDLEALQLLNHFAGVDGFNQFNTKKIKEVRAEVYPIKKSDQLAKTHVFARFSDVTSHKKLDFIKELEGVRFVSVVNLMSLMKVKMTDNKVTYDSRALITIFKDIIKRGLIPYVQISFVDYEALKEVTEEPTTFYDIFNQLAFELECEFKEMDDWYFEFRCFYELDHSGKLCRPVKDIIPRFKMIGQTLIHLPVQPSLQVLPDETKGAVGIIDDRARVKKYNYQEVLDLLTEPKYIDIISENKNIKWQVYVVERMNQLEEDVYYQQFTDLVYANQMLWMFMYNLTKKTATFEPMTLDGTTLFTYFPKSMSQKLSVLSENNIRRDMWYAYQFRGKLYKSVVFSNEFCIITKQGDNYRLLAIYPEQEVIESLFKRESTFEQEAIMRLTINFKELFGTYQIIEQKITPEIKSLIKEMFGINESEKLSSTLINYLDHISQPKFILSERQINGELDFEIELPVFGISYIEFNRIL